MKKPLSQRQRLFVWELDDDFKFFHCLRSVLGLIVGTFVAFGVFFGILGVGDVDLGGVDDALFLGGTTNTKKPKISYNRAMTITVDLSPEVAHSLAQKAALEGQDVAHYLQQLAMREAQTAPQGPSALRTPGLHAGQYWIADDFDALLPDSFWLSEEDGAEAVSK